MENTPIFKTSLFGGFERQSVLNYIFELNNSAKATQDRLTAQFEEVGAARERLTETVRGLEQRLTSADQVRQNLENQLQAERDKQGETDSLIASLNVEINRQKQIVAEKDAEIARFDDVKAELERKNAELQAKSEEVTKASIYIGEMVVRTKLEAEKILEDANSQAKAVAEEATKSLGTVFDQFSKFRGEMELIEEKIEDAVISMQRKFAAIGDTLNESEDQIRNFYRPYNITLVDPIQQDSAPAGENTFRDTADC